MFDVHPCANVEIVWLTIDWLSCVLRRIGYISCKLDVLPKYVSFWLRDLHVNAHKLAICMTSRHYTLYNDDIWLQYCRYAVKHQPTNTAGTL